MRFSYTGYKCLQWQTFVIIIFNWPTEAQQHLKDRSNTYLTLMRQQKERPRLGYTGEATMIHDNFPGHYTAYKTYYIIIIIVAISASSCNETFQRSICTFHAVVLSFFKQTCLEAVEVIYVVFASRRKGTCTIRYNLILY